jgi:hypothetical protein
VTHRSFVHVAGLHEAIQASTRCSTSWLGWLAAFAGLFSVAAGLVQAFTGEPTVASLVLTIIGPTIISLWVLVMGVLMGRQAARSRS